VASSIIFKDLQKLVAAQQQESTHKQLFTRLQGKPFYIWDKQQHREEYKRADGDCCFNHIIGLPQKDGNDKPLYDYENIIYDTLSTHDHKHVWIKKATGLGVSEFMLRFIYYIYT
jgi:hypothetical protein